jgi:septal ring factor EnvC (AmiA/AmiB activator)
MRFRALLAISVLAVIAGGYLLYEMGRIHAGFNRFENAEVREQLEARIAELEAANRALREQQVQLETMAKTEQETYREVGSTLRELQSKIQEQREAIAFYRGIISPEESESGLRIQDLKVLRGAGESGYRLRMVLVQVKRHHREVYGKVQLSVDGTLDGEAVTLPLGRLVDGADPGRWNYAFRYFQDFERDLVLPEGFNPESINVELVPSGRGNVGIRQSFTWSTSSG